MVSLKWTCCFWCHVHMWMISCLCWMLAFTGELFHFIIFFFFFFLSCGLFFSTERSSHKIQILNLTKEDCSIEKRFKLVTMRPYIGILRFKEKSSWIFNSDSSVGLKVWGKLSNHFISLCRCLWLSQIIERENRTQRNSLHEVQIKFQVLYLLSEQHLQCRVLVTLQQALYFWYTVQCLLQTW